MKARPPPQSIQFRLAADEALRIWNAKRHLQPRCGARAKHSGEPCRQVAMKNGRCVYHGGATPRGDAWHKIQPPKPGPTHVRKLRRKLTDIERNAKKRARRLAAMTSEEQAAHRAWQKTHAPGSKKKRAAERARRKADVEARKMLARADEPQPESPELIAIQREIERLQREIEEAERRDTLNILD